MKDPRYKIIESKVWKHKITGASASIYGACPWTSQTDKPHWEMVHRGWTVRDRRFDSVGPILKQTREEVEQWVRSQGETFI